MVMDKYTNTVSQDALFSEYFSVFIKYFPTLIVQNNSNTNRPYSKSQAFVNQLKINAYISLLILNS